MKKIAWITKNWRKLAKEDRPYGDRSLLDLYEGGELGRGTVWNILFAGVKTRRHNKPAKQSVLDAYEATKEKFIPMSCAELEARDKEWDKRYPSKIRVEEEEDYGAMGTLEKPKEEKDDEE